MKPFSILLTIILGLVSLSLVVWLGQYKAGGILTTSEVGTPDVKDNGLPLPKFGPFGKAEVDEVEFQFGAKLIGATDEHTFTIKNVGKGSLELKLGKPTCQCTVGEISKVGSNVVKSDSVKPGQQVSLAPGEAVNILVKWVMKTEMVLFRQSVPVFTTDPQQREIELIVSGSVDSLFKFRPPTLWDIGEISKSEPTKAWGLVISTVVDEFTLTELPRESDVVKLSWDPAPPDQLEKNNAKSGYVISLEVSPNVPIGLFREVIKLKAAAGKTESEKPEAVSAVPEKVEADKAEVSAASADNTELIQEITVLGRRLGPIEVHASGAGFTLGSNRLIFADFPAAEGKKAKLTFFVKGMNEDLVVKSVEASDPRIKVEFLGAGKMLGNTKSYQMEVEIQPGPAGKHRDLNAPTVDLKLNHPEAPDFRILVDYNATR